MRKNGYMRKRNEDERDRNYKINEGKEKILEITEISSSPSLCLTLRNSFFLSRSPYPRCLPLVSPPSFYSSLFSLPSSYSILFLFILLLLLFCPHSYSLPAIPFLSLLPISPSTFPYSILLLLLILFFLLFCIHILTLLFHPSPSLFPSPSPTPSSRETTTHYKHSQPCFFCCYSACIKALN